MTFGYRYTHTLVKHSVPTPHTHTAHPHHKPAHEHRAIHILTDTAQTPTFQTLTHPFRSSVSVPHPTYPYTYTNCIYEYRIWVKCCFLPLTDKDFSWLFVICNDKLVSSIYVLVPFSYVIIFKRKSKLGCNLTTDFMKCCEGFFFPIHFLSHSLLLPPLSSLPLPSLLASVHVCLLPLFPPSFTISSHPHCLFPPTLPPSSSLLPRSLSLPVTLLPSPFPLTSIINQWISQ